MRRPSRPRCTLSTPVCFVLAAPESHALIEGTHPGPRTWGYNAVVVVVIVVVVVVITIIIITTTVTVTVLHSNLVNPTHPTPQDTLRKPYLLAGHQVVNEPLCLHRVLSATYLPQAKHGEGLVLVEHSGVRVE